MLSYILTLCSTAYWEIRNIIVHRKWTTSAKEEYNIPLSSAQNEGRFPTVNRTRPKKRERKANSVTTVFIFQLKLTTLSKFQSVKWLLQARLHPSNTQGAFFEYLMTKNKRKMVKLDYNALHDDIIDAKSRTSHAPRSHDFWFWCWPIAGSSK